MPWTKTRATYARLGLIALLAVSVLLWFRFVPPEAPWSPRNILAFILPPAKVVEKIVTVEIEGPERIRVIPKEKVVEIYRYLPMPETMQDNDAWVTSVVETPPAPYGGTAAAILVTGDDNVATGRIEFLPTPAPFFEIKRTMGIRGGYGTEGIMGELFVQPLRVGPVVLEGRVYGRSDRGDSEVGAAVLLEWRF